MKRSDNEAMWLWLGILLGAMITGIMSLLADYLFGLWA